MDKPTGGRQKGQALVELALTLPLILLLVLGAMDFGRMYFAKIFLTNAAREGANYLSRRSSECRVSGVIDEDLCVSQIESLITLEAEDSGRDIDDIVIDIADCCTVNMPVTVTASESIDLIFGPTLSWLGLTDGPIDLSSSVQMLVQ